MNEVSTVTLELLRHGKRYGQLLSELTQYLALCGGDDPVTVKLPYDHQQMLLRLRALRYRDSDTTREMQLKKTGERMGQIFAQVPALLAELVRTPQKSSSLIHLQVVFSSAELALLPFELAQAPGSFPGEGQEILLQNSTRICLTRQQRRTAEDSESYYDGRPPHILFAFAEPPGAGTVPWREHYAALRVALNPWVSQYGPSKQSHQNEDEIQAHRLESAKQLLTVIPNASAKAVLDACAKHNPTHVHILAHGIETRRAGNTRYSLALHRDDDKSQLDAVGEDRLACALRGRANAGDSYRACPTTVTIASCDSGQHGDVIGAGSSLAHALHVQGIPLVVASQFPLTKAGSVYLVKKLYPDLLWGKDPRETLTDIRSQLNVVGRDNHDWASMIVYAAFPPNFEDTLSDMQFDRAREAISVALEDMDEMTPDYSETSETRIEKRTADDIELFLKRTKAPKNRLRKLAARHLDCNGILAATCKREAEILIFAYRLDRLMKETGARDLFTRMREDRLEFSNESPKESQYKRILELLEESHEYYTLVYEQNRGTPWVRVQLLALDAVLYDVNTKTSTIGRDNWLSAKVNAEAEAEWNSENRDLAGWALGSLCELYIMKPLYNPASTSHENDEEARNNRLKIKEYAGRLVRGYPETIFSTLRQIQRHVWLFKLSPEVVDLARYALTFFPTEPSAQQRK